MKEKGKGETMAKDSATRKVNKESHSIHNRARNPGRKEGANNAGGYGQKEQGQMMKEGSKTKDGCLPKLFMLLMPFIAVGAYFFLRP
jgi:hypothetical protein